ncbi:hypothetical protein BATDEDRAFT_34789 [Batrachochytrium dendrobatidis JAM81]|uniref:DM14 domain-containing protein n=1 Tax=Batrachochytrium dendrobatidis (strain JAM81 / FGSC 10211) TaxID=684364 RepID=F4P024_BATDJ|nr:uncharacterized protein BATDEDRAFT_34789 [Batrachochytrium dendrobatidis JAM81]EGF81497.1 hypothetical protein BATDEDRAFT_34789 [Batrachochytrium dendrobatidis JAM81]|eukprot:XP_006678004.1 hypothetical protein BATDEDRAFT_34789 [Batrachochytrium dendrobatidis JAM81]
MWKFGTTEPNKPKSFTPASGIDFDLPEPSFTDDDLNDPHLLAELALLSESDGHTTVSNPTPPTTIFSPKKLPVKTQPLEYALDTVVDLPASHDEEVHVEFTDADMHDPDLLAELGKIHDHNSPNAAHTTFSPDTTPTLENHDHLETASPIQATNVYIQSSQEADLVHSTQTTTVESTLSDTDKSTKLPIYKDDSDLPLEYRLKTTDPNLLAKYIQLEKIRAVNKKRDGNKEGAFESLKAMKQLQARLKTVTDEAFAKPKSAQPLQTTLTTLSISQKLDARQYGSGSNLSLGHGSFSSQSIQALQPTITLEALQKRQTEYKHAALKSKRDNDFIRAREMLLVIKKIQDAIDLYTATSSISPGFILPCPPSNHPSPKLSGSPKLGEQHKSAMASRLSVRSATSSQVNSTSNLESESSSQVVTSSEAKDIYDHLLKTLQSQIALCTTLSTNYYKSNQKEIALEFHRKKKRMEMDSEALKHLRNLNSPSTVSDSPSTSPVSSSNVMLPFMFHYEDLEYTLAHTNQDVPLDEMEISILKATDLGNREIAAGEVDSSVGYDIGWPQEGDVTTAEGRGETPIVRKNSNPEYGFKRNIRIIRSRPFQRFLERKKVFFEVIHTKPGILSMLMTRQIVLGRAAVKLEPLLTKCEIHEIIKLGDPSNPRRETGATLEIKIRLRTPIVKPDIVTKTERWLVVELGSPISASTTEITAHTGASTSPRTAFSRGNIASPSKTNDPTKAKNPPRVSSPVSPNDGNASPSKPVQNSTLDTKALPAVVSPAPAHELAQPKPAQKEIVDLDSLELDFQNPDKIASNQVLEHEHGQILAQIAQLTVTRKPIPEEIQDKKTAYEIRMNLLVTLIQLGKLDMTSYVAQVKTSITTTRTAAMEFKRAGRMDLVKQALIRVKLMTAEMEEVEQSM